MSARPDKDFDFGLNKMLDYLDKENVAVFNLYRSSGWDRQGYSRANQRITAERSLPLASSADVDCFRGTQVETACLLAQEEVARRLRKVW